MIGDCNCFMSPFIRTLYQIFCIRNTVHIAHLCMAVQFHTFLWTGIHSGASEICNLLDTGNRSDRQFTVKSVNRCYAFKLQKSTFFDRFLNFWHLLITQEHFYHNGIRKIRHRKNQNCLFITDLTRFHVHDLTSNDDFSHLTGNGFQINGISLEISSVNNVRIAVSAEAAMKITALAFFLKCF